MESYTEIKLYPSTVSISSISLQYTHPGVSYTIHDYFSPLNSCVCVCLLSFILLCVLLLRVNVRFLSPDLP